MDLDFMHGPGYRLFYTFLMWALGTAAYIFMVRKHWINGWSIWIDSIGSFLVGASLLLLTYVLVLNALHYYGYTELFQSLSYFNTGAAL